MRNKLYLSAAIHALVIVFVANSFPLIRQHPGSLWVLVPLFLLACVFSGSFTATSFKRRVCFHGTVLLYAFWIASTVSLLWQLPLALLTVPDDYTTLLWSDAQCIGVLFVVFWLGILCVYLTSAQLGFRMRLLGVLCGLIPVINLIALCFILSTVTNECLFELEKDELNRDRKDARICATQYPILLVHGFFFRDIKYFNYWGRIPRELEINGATIFYGNQPSALSVADSAAILAERIEQILEETGAEKVNIIAHSKGGLDIRYAMAYLGVSHRVASLTTVNTPHRGCEFADYLLTKVSDKFKNRVARTYNTATRRLGEKDTDFLAAVNNLTGSYCKQLDAEMPAPDGVFCQSIGSVLKKASSGVFPVNISYHLVNLFSGENDGLVSEDSFAWGEKYILLRAPGRKGISHSDIIDLTRENIPQFDVREFYVQLVHDLKQRGL